MKCQNCNYVIDTRNKYCGNCGDSLERQCCDCLVRTDKRFCVNCGIRTVESIFSVLENYNPV